MTTITDTQRDDAWFAARAGKVTASRFKDVLARNKPTAAQAKAGEPGNPSADRTRYLWQIVTERLTGQPVITPDAAPLRWGRENEDAARVAYQFTTSARITETGFIAHPKLPIGASPDGLVSDESDPDGAFGLIEIKCPWNSGSPLTRCTYRCRSAGMRGSKLTKSAHSRPVSHIWPCICGM